VIAPLLQFNAARDFGDAANPLRVIIEIDGAP